MQIDASDEQNWKVYSSMDDSFEPDANVAVKRDAQPQKQRRQSLSTEAGMRIDKSPVQFSKA
jgi:hypothetical protein